MEHPQGVPCLVVADSQGRIMDFPELQMAGMSNGAFYRPEPEDLIALPHGSELFALPGRLPVGWDQETDEPVLLSENPHDHGPVQAVAAFMAPAHTAIYSSAYQSEPGAPTLPLFAYTAVGWYRDRFWVSAFRSDQDRRQDADQYRQDVVERKTRKSSRGTRTTGSSSIWASVASPTAAPRPVTTSSAAGKPRCPPRRSATPAVSGASLCSPLAAALPPRKESLSSPTKKKSANWQSPIWKRQRTR